MLLNEAGLQRIKCGTAALGCEIRPRITAEGGCATCSLTLKDRDLDSASRTGETPVLRAEDSRLGCPESPLI